MDNPNTIFEIAGGFEKRIHELNNTFRLHYEEMINLPLQKTSDDDDGIPETVKLQLRVLISDLYHYTLENYSKIPENKRVEIRYYSPSSDDFEEMLISTAIRYVFLLYLRSLEDHDVITDPDIIQFGNNVIDHYRIPSQV